MFSSCELLRNPQLLTERNSIKTCKAMKLTRGETLITTVVVASKERNYQTNNYKRSNNCSSSRGRREGLSMESPPKGYRRNVGICLVNPSKMIFTASRINIPDTWQMPQGGADDGEDLRNAAMRELREETGVTSAEFLAEAPYWLTYDFPIKIRDRLNRRWGTKYRGQAQKWFLFKFTGEEKEINLLGDGSEKPEFKNWSWMLPERVVELAVDFKRPVYEKVMKLFGPYLQANAEEIHYSKQTSTGSKMQIETSLLR